MSYKKPFDERLFNYASGREGTEAAKRLHKLAYCENKNGIAFPFDRTGGQLSALPRLRTADIQHTKVKNT